MSKKREKIVRITLPVLLLFLCLIIPVFATIPEAPNFIGGEASSDGSKILLTFDKDMGTLPEAPAGFSVTVDGVENPITAVALNTNPAIVELSLTDIIYANVTNIQVSYTAGTVVAADGGVLADFTGQSVTNNSMITQDADSIIIPTTATFDRNNQADIEITMELNGNNLLGLKNGETDLISGTDYIVVANIVTIKQIYLTMLGTGTCNITFDFSAGDDSVLAINVVEGNLAAPVFSSAGTSTDGSKILLTFDKDMGTLPEAPAGFSVTVDGVENPITAVSLNTNPAIVELSLTDIIYANATNIQVSYTAGTVVAADGGVLADFTGQSVINNSTISVSLPLLTINYFYDNQNRLDYIELSTGETIDYQYDLNGNLINKVLVD